MDKLLRDMDALCQTTAKEREERYRVRCRRFPIETAWKEQQLTDEEMATIRGHNMVMDILFNDNEDEGPHYGKTCDETFDEILKNMVDELQDMVELFEYMNMIEDCDIDDMLNQLEGNISVYNEGI